MNMILLSIRRRKKDIRYVSIVTFTAVFFMAGILLLQEMLNRFVLERNYRNYGEWVVSSIDEQLDHPYFSMEGCSKTAAQIQDEEKKNLGIYVGTVDSRLWEMGNFELYEGHLPQNSDEAVMDLYTLSKMNCSYDLGQEILIRYREKIDDEWVEQEKTYRLVGTLKSREWVENERKPMPDILVTDEELRTYQLSHTTWFYQLNRAYQNIDTMEFADSFRKDKKQIQYNSYVYGQQLWVSAEAFDYVSYLMIAVSILAIGYLLSSYTGKRRQIYDRYRCMGADRGQVRRMIITECLYASVPAAVGGLALAYGTAIAGTALAAGKNNLPSFFVWNPSLLLRQVLSIVLMLGGAIFWTVLRTGERSLVQSSSTVSGRALKRMYRLAKKSKKPEKEILKRQNRIHPVSRMIVILFSVISCSFLVLSANVLYRKMKGLTASYEQALDFRLSKRVEYSISDGMGTNKSDYYEVISGIGEEEWKQLSFIEGISDLKLKLTDSIHYLAWEGMESSPNSQYYEKNNMAGNFPPYYTFIYFYETDEYARSVAADLGGESELNWERWNAGNEILVLVETQYGWGDQREIYPNETLNSGDEIELVNAVTGDRTPVTAGVVYNTMMSKNGFQYHTGNYTVFASRKLADKMAQIQGGVPEDNSLNGFMNSSASYEATDTQLARFAAENGFEYNGTDEEARNRIWEEIWQTLGIYGSLFLLVAVIYVILQRNFVESRNRYRREQYRLLKQIGMDDSGFLRNVGRDSAAEYLWLTAGIPIGALMDGYLVYQEFVYEFAATSGMMVSSRLLNNYTADPRWLALDHVLFDIDYRIGIVLTAVLILFMISLNLILTRKYMKSEEK